jgi:FMN phosphatase YigB (HAD superfamily)
VQRPRLEKSKIDRFFEVIVISDEIGVAKPHKGFFDHTFTEMQHSDPSSVLVIGDSINADIKGGQQYGTATCWMNPEGQKAPMGINPDYEIRDLLGLRNLL